MRRDVSLHRVVRITGPTHNVLAIEFNGEGGLRCVVEPLGPGLSRRGQLTDDEVKEWVLAIVAEANEEIGTHLIVRRIKYVADDTRDPNAYAAMARELVNRGQARLLIRPLLHLSGVALPSRVVGVVFTDVLAWRSSWSGATLSSRWSSRTELKPIS